MTSPASVLSAWFAAHNAGDMAAARALMIERAVIQVPDAALHGFDEFMQWYANRRATIPGFHYEVLDILGGEGHAAAVIRLHDGARSWRQIAVYAIADGQITAMTAYEDAPD